MLDTKQNKKCGEQILPKDPPKNCLDDPDPKKVCEHPIPIKCAEVIHNNEENAQEAKWGRFWVQIQQGDRSGGPEASSTIQYFELIFYGKSMYFQ